MGKRAVVAERLRGGVFSSPDCRARVGAFVWVTKFRFEFGFLLQTNRATRFDSTWTFGSITPRKMPPVPVNNAHAGPSNVDKSMRSSNLSSCLVLRLANLPWRNSEDGCHDGRQ